MAANLQEFEHIYRHFRSGLSSFARAIVRNENDADEIVNDVFLSVWEKRDSLELNLSLKNYLFTSVKNRCLNHIKKAKLPFAEMPDEFEFHADINSNAQKQLENKELKSYIHNLIDQLPPKCKQVFLLSRYFDLSHKEISDVMDISPKTVENQIGIALKFLKEQSLRTKPAG
jgi:RNA polymerase sigma-70 factor (family 1)